MVEIFIKDIIVDDFIYARDQKDSKNTEVLVEKLKAGIILDPIQIQRVSGYEFTSLETKLGEKKKEEVIILLDGGHRLDAYAEYNKLAQQEIKELGGYQEQQPTFIFYKDEVIDYEANKVALLVHAHNVNDDKGLNARMQDTRKAARNMKLVNPNLTAEDIGRELRRERSTISKHIKDIVQQQQASEKRIAVRLSKLGRTQTEIGEVMGITQPRVSQIINNVNVHIIYNSYAEGKSIEEIASFNDLDIQTVWNMILDGKSDIERFEALSIPLKLYDDWSFQGCDTRMGMVYPGRIPGQLVMNTLYYYTSPGDLVIDPMAGGGTVVDACLLMGRKCYAYDLEPLRDDIQKHDIEQSLPDASDKCNLMFIDPPYWSMLDDKYSDKAVSSKTLAQFNEWIAKLASDCYSTLKTGAKLAFLIQNQTEKDIPEGEYYLDHVFSAQKAFIDTGFKMVRRINCPLNSETYTPQQVNTNKEAKHLMGLVRDLLIVIKE